MNELLSLADVEQIVNLIAEVSDPQLELGLPERKRLLVEGVSRMIGADVYVWSTAIPNPDNFGDVMAACLIDGGWATPQQQIDAYKAMSNPHFATEASRGIVAAAMQQRYVTMHRCDFIPDADWARLAPVWHQTGLDEMLVNVYPIDQRCYSSIGFHRQLGKPPYSNREQAIAHVTLRQVDWLHRHATNTASQAKLPQLSPRERQTLVLLLGGERRREIAERLRLTEATIGDYTKRIFKQFDVHSRGELQSLFMTSATPSAQD